LKDNLQSVFNQYYSDLCRHALYYLGDEGESENVVQEVFVQLWKKHRNILENQEGIRSYLYTAVRNRALNAIRDVKAHSEEEVEHRAGDLRTELEEKELLARVTELVRELPPKCRHIFLLSRSKGYSNKQIAEELDISVKTVENQMTKALKLLRVGLKTGE